MLLFFVSFFFAFIERKTPAIPLVFFSFNGQELMKTVPIKITKMKKFHENYFLSRPIQYSMAPILIIRSKKLFLFFWNVIKKAKVSFQAEKGFRAGNELGFFFSFWKVIISALWNEFSLCKGRASKISNSTRVAENLIADFRLETFVYLRHQ